MPRNSSTGSLAKTGSMLARTLAVIVAVATASFFSTGCAAIKAPPADGASTDAWPTAYHDRARSNITGAALTFPLAAAWGKDTTVPFTGLKHESSSPAMEGWEMFVGSSSGRVLAYEIYTGRELWTFKTGAPVASPPAASKKELCVGAHDGLLRCLSRATGEKLWSFQARTEITSSPLILDSAVVFASSDDRVYALDRATGKELWNYSHGSFRTVTPRTNSSPAYANGRIFVLFSDSTLACISEKTGRKEWTRRTGVNLESASAGRRTPIVKGGRVYVINDPRTVAAYDAATGDLEELFSAGVDAGEVVDMIVEADGSVILSTTKTVARFNSRTYAPEWTFDAPKSGTVSSTTLAGGHLLVVSNYTTPRRFFKRSYATVTSIDAVTGSTVWAKTFRGRISAPPAAAGERLAILTDRGDLRVLAPKKVK